MTAVLIAAIVVGALTLLHPAAEPTRSVTVLPGDTMLSVVLRELPNWDPARASAAIEALNDVSGSSLPVGLVLRVPATG